VEWHCIDPCFIEWNDDLTGLLSSKADHALYRAKANGRRHVRMACDERMVPKTTHYTQIQLERHAKLAEERGVNEADLLCEAMDDFLTKYGVNDIET
jgi:predicted signal transduction protein with EAL and GGDEF domain